MQVDEEKLLRSGFSQSDIRKVKNNLESYGGTLDNAINDLSRRFVIAICVVICCVAVFAFLLFLSSQQTVFSGGIALLFGIAAATLYSHLCYLINHGAIKESTVLKSQKS